MRGEGCILQNRWEFKVHRFYLSKKKNTKRVLNLLYINSDWKKEWKGDLELWDKNDKKKKELSPLINNAIIFRTDKDSNHGFLIIFYAPKRE